jgi:uncharacterized protein involved in exopolysaccharide biosynthesis
MTDESRTRQVPSESGDASGEPRAPAVDELTFLDLLIVLAKHKSLIVGLPFVAAVLAAGMSLLLPNVFTATTKILPPQQGQSNAVAILGQLGALGGGASQMLGVKNPNDVFIAMLMSRTVADNVIRRFELGRIYDTSVLADTRRILAKNTRIVSGRDGIISIDFDDIDPKRAAAIANAYVEELRRLTLRLAVSEASQRRLFFETQLNDVKEALARAENDLKDFREAKGLLNPEGQATLTVSAAASIHAQITAREVQLAAMRTFATAENPDVVRIQQEIAGLRSELARMEKNANRGKGDVLVPVGKAPGIGLEYIRRFRDVRYNEALFELLAKQYEIARIDEAKDATLIQVLDQAVEPERKSKPRRTFIVMLVSLGAFVIGVLATLLMEALQEARANPNQARRLALLRRLLSGR